MKSRPLAAVAGLLLATAARAVPAPTFYLLALQVDLEPSPALLAATARIAAAEEERRGEAMPRGFPETFRVRLEPGTTPAEALGPLVTGYRPGEPGTLQIDSVYEYGIRASLRTWAGPRAPTLLSEIFAVARMESISLERSPEGFHLTYLRGSNCFAGCTEGASATFAFDPTGHPLGLVAGDPEELERYGPSVRAARVAAPSDAGVYGLPATEPPGADAGR